MNIKKLAASLMMLSLCTVGVENVSAAAAPRHVAPDRLVNDLDTLPDTAPEKQLFNELSAKEFDVMGDRTFTPRGIHSLKKYMRCLLDLKPNLINDVHALTDDDHPEFALKLSGLADKISLKYHNDATTKAANTREMLERSNDCLDAICSAIEVIDVDDPSNVLLDKFRVAFSRAQAAAIGNEGSLAEAWEGYWEAKRGGATANAIEAHLLQLCRVIDSLNKLAIIIAEKATTPEKMGLFHYMYGLLCRTGAADKLMGVCNRRVPGFEAQYDAWLAKTGYIKPIPKSRK